MGFLRFRGYLVSAYILTVARRIIYVSVPFGWIIRIWMHKNCFPVTGST